MKLSEFYKLAPFITPIEAEKLIVRFVNSGYVYVHVDFRNGTLNFKNYVKMEIFFLLFLKIIN